MQVINIPWLKLLLILCFGVLTGCTTPAPTYKYIATSASDPQISFESDFVLHTNFSVNITNPDLNLCNDYDSVGYLLKADSILIYDKPNREIKIQVPSNKFILVHALHYYSDGGRTVRCGPITKKFMPLDNHQYVVNMQAVNGFCGLQVLSVDENNQRTEIQTERVLKQCVR